MRTIPQYLQQPNHQGWQRHDSNARRTHAFVRPGQGIGTPTLLVLRLPVFPEALMKRIFQRYLLDGKNDASNEAHEDHTAKREHQSYRTIHSVTGHNLMK